MSGSDGPGCIVGSVDRICFLHWSPRPTVDEVRAVVDAVLSERRTVGRPLTLVVFIRADSELPERSASVEMVRKAAIIDGALESGITVLPGNGLRTRLVRASLNGLGTLLRTPWDIVGDADEALVRACWKPGLDFDRVRMEAIARGLFPETSATTD